MTTSYIARPLAALALAFAGLAAQASPISFTFSATVQGGAFDGTVGTGTFGYESTLITGVGTEFLTAAGGLSVDFKVFGIDFSEINDRDFDGFPQVTFLNGLPTNIDFLLTAGTNGVVFPDPNIIAVAIGGNAPLTPGELVRFETTMQVFANEGNVPEPASVALVGLALLGVGAARRRRG